jgi:hypothetical protein
MSIHAWQLVAVCGAGVLYLFVRFHVVRWWRAK